jgi:hypothetical protein
MTALRQRNRLAQSNVVETLNVARSGDNVTPEGWREWERIKAECW